MKRNANLTLRIGLAATAVLLFAEWSFAAQTYVVCKGETLYRVAKKFHTSVSALQGANGLDSSNIRSGQTLRVPSTEAASQDSHPTTYGRVLRRRVEAKQGGETVATLHRGDMVAIIGRDGGRFKVRLSDGRTGFVSDDVVSLEDARKPLAVSDRWSVKSDVVRTAFSYRGARYRSGGISASGFDCSGFVKYVYASKGISLPHSSAAMYGCGKPVSKSDLRPGDMVFFNFRGGGVSHVGLYAGKGRFIHASNPRSGVRVDKLNAPGYNRRYVGARRL